MAKKKTVGKPFKKNNPKTGEKDSRINRNGPPPKGETFAGCLRELLSLDGPGVEAWAGKQAKEFTNLPAGVPLRSLICLWAVASLSRDFTSGVWTALMDRTDGKIGDDLETRIQKLESLLEVKDAQQSGATTESKSIGDTDFPEAGHEPGTVDGEVQSGNRSVP